MHMNHELRVHLSSIPRTPSALQLLEEDRAAHPDDYVDTKEDPFEILYTSERIRYLSILAIFITVILNGADVVTTHFLLSHGGSELNPLSAFLLQANAVLWVKLGALLALGTSVIYHRGRLQVLCLCWGLVGLYATVVLSNALLLREVM